MLKFDLGAPVVDHRQSAVGADHCGNDARMAMKAHRSKITITLALIVSLALLGCVAAFYYRSQGPLFSRGRRAQSDPQVAVAIRKLLDAWDHVQMASAKVDMLLDDAAGMEGDTKGEGRYDFLKDNGRTSIRFKLTNLLRIKSPEEGDNSTYWTAERLIFVTDGAVLHRSIEQSGHTTATKVKYDPDDILQVGGRHLFDALQRVNRLSLLPDQTLQGKDVYVIEAESLDDDSKSIHYFEKETGIRLKMVEKDQSGGDYLAITLSEVDLSPQFEPDHFTFTPPEEVERVDETPGTP